MTLPDRERLLIQWLDISEHRWRKLPQWCRAGMMKLNTHLQHHNAVANDLRHQQPITHAYYTVGHTPIDDKVYIPSRGIILTDANEVEQLQLMWDHANAKLRVMGIGLPTPMCVYPQAANVIEVSNALR